LSRSGLNEDYSKPGCRKLSPYLFAKSILKIEEKVFF
jgi:hypothetical protein